MDNNNINKEMLYELVTDKYLQCGYSFERFKGINSIQLAQSVCNNLEIKYLDFSEMKICGILYKDSCATSIALNNKRSDRGKNFDCMHELIHYWLHDDNYFYCNDDLSTYNEWQANEGAAQFLMPYQVFIPKVVETYDMFCRSYPKAVAIKKFQGHLSYFFNVGEKAIQFRTQNLNYEIKQFIQTNDINNIEFLSFSKQKSLGYA